GFCASQGMWDFELDSLVSCDMEEQQQQRGQAKDMPSPGVPIFDISSGRTETAVSYTPRATRESTFPSSCAPGGNTGRHIGTHVTPPPPLDGVPTEAPIRLHEVAKKRGGLPLVNVIATSTHLLTCSNLGEVRFF